MLNYILADYKRIVSRIPRLVVLVLFELGFVGYVLFKWSKALGAYNSVSLMGHSNTFFGTVFLLLLTTVAFVQSFSYDFRYKTIQVAIGIGISRMRVVICKLIQFTLVVITDLLITYVVFAVLCIVTGTPLTAHQVAQMLVKGLYSVLIASCSAALAMPLVFRTQNMIMSMIAYLLLQLGIFTNILHWISRAAPEFIVRLQLERFTHDSFIGLLQTNLLMGRFQLLPLLGTAFYFALGIYLTWFAFRKLELDF